MKTALFSAGMLVLLACGTTEMTAGETAQDAGKTVEIREATLGKTPANGQATNILAARIDGNKLIVEVSYVGGCQEHFFELVGSEAISKSLPPQRSIHLVHTGEPDICEAMVAKTLEFDIRNLAYRQEAGSEIILKLDGWKDGLRYVYR